MITRQIKSIIADLENRLKVAEAEEKRTEPPKNRKDELINSFSSGAVAALKYAIKELKSIKEETP